ncbi:MAG: glutaredoxin family protein [Anaplasmataceae bacterium]|nr:glutaredoxin family protein [Anaplasmataceae bacterium]
MSQVIIYSTPTCVYCKAAKDYFSQNNIAYTEHNVAEDEKALEEMQNKSGQFGVPVIDINGTIVVGFDKPAIAKLLKLS